MALFKSIPLFKTKSKVPQQVMSTYWDDRERILEEYINLFIWERSLDSGVQAFLQEVLDQHPMPVKVCVNQNDLHHQLASAKKIWDDAGIPDCPAFWRDLSTIVYDFLDFTETGSGIVHLRVVEDDACTKFHIDGYRLRLFATYFGKGTEWLPEDAVNRAALGTENNRIVRDSLSIRHVEAGHVSILKGELPNEPLSARGIVHRSPGIAHTREKRIILRVDI